MEVTHTSRKSSNGKQTLRQRKQVTQKTKLKLQDQTSIPLKGDKNVK